jgi:hypothetical protein
MKEKTVAAAAPAPASWRRIAGSSGQRHATLPVLMALALLHAFSVHARQPVLQRGYDANVSGATLSETTLNTSNVVPGSFGLVFKLAVDDNLMAEPLYVPNVVIKGISHNVVYVASMSDTVYAFDADVGGAPLWQFNLAAFEHAIPLPLAKFTSNRSLIGNLGILSTPVIDRSTNTLYAVACALENNALVYRLHAVDITTGTPRTGSGVVISGSYKTITFDARTQWQRASLVLSGNTVVFAFGPLENEGGYGIYSGWVMAYDKSTLAQTGIFATETIGNGGAGVWQSGRPPAVDSSGYVYVFTGNGFGMGYDGVNNFSESVLKLDPAHGLSLVDWFTPAGWLNLDNSDTDLSGSGPLLVPGTSLLIGGGKSSILYVLNTENLGKNTAKDIGAIQKITLTPGGSRGGPVYWQRSAASGGPLLFEWGLDDQLKAFPFNGSRFATTPSALGNVTNQIYPGGILTLSANGGTPGTGVLWATVSMSGVALNHPPTPGELYAFDAGNVATQLWNSNLDAARDSLGNFAKFVPPLVANGKVYVATWSNQVSVYGLLAPVPLLSAVSPTRGPITGGTAVKLSGQNFASGATVTFGGAAATNVVVVSGSQITANTPPDAQGSANIVVTNPGGKSATLAKGFTFLPPVPKVTGVSPTSGTTAGGSAVTLTGQNFAPGARVIFGGAPATSVVVVSATQITAKTPPHAQGTMNVTVINPSGQSGTLANGFTFVALAPVVNSVSPNTGTITGDTRVTLTGSNFVSGATVTFGGVAATSVVVVSATQLAATVPAHQPGAVSVVVTNPGGQSGTLANGFTYN